MMPDAQQAPVQARLALKEAEVGKQSKGLQA